MRFRMLVAMLGALALLAAVPATGLAKAPDRSLPSFSGTSTATDGTPVDISATITRVYTQGGQLVADGTATYTAGGQSESQAFTAVPVSSNRGSKCSILFLDLPPIHLDLLGLVLDTSRITIDLSAVSGPNKLLGNLLCSVTGLLDGPGSGTGLSQLLDRINGILTGLGL